MWNKEFLSLCSYCTQTILHNTNNYAPQMEENSVLFWKRQMANLLKVLWWLFAAAE